MQKIQFYLVPNRITVTTDLVGYNTEYRQVYQRKIKLHKGIDNTLEFEVKNSDQRRENVVGWQVVVKFLDTDRRNLFSVSGSAITSKVGLMSVTVPKELLAPLDPQMLVAAAYLTNGTEEKILYSDSQFDVLAHVEVLDAYNDQTESVEELTVFNYEYDKKAFTSEIGRFGWKVNHDYSSEPYRTVNVSFEGDYEGTVEVEVTKDKSTAFGTTWVRLAPWDVTLEPTKTYPSTPSEIDNWNFIRFVYGGTGKGFGATFTVTVTNGEYSNVAVTYRGQGYQVGDQVLVKGSWLGGDDGVNDLTITVNKINESPLGAIDTTSITWSGVAAVQNGYYRHVPSTNPEGAKAVDKIIIRS